MPRRAARFRVRGLAPATDPAWRAAPLNVRSAFMQAALAYVLKAKDQELAAGLDKDGRDLVPIRPNTKKYRISRMGPADPNAPPLMPAYATSRTRLWLTAKVVDGTAIEVTWKNDWGAVLLYHAEGKGRRGRRIAKRDVIGLSPESLNKARGWALGWWLHFKRTGQFLQRNVPTTGGFRPLVATGRTDFENFTFGIRSTSDKAAEVARGRVLVAEGRTTGFRQRRPGQGLPALGGPGTRFGGQGPGPGWLAPRPVPPPRPRPLAPPPPAVASPAPVAPVPAATGRPEFVQARLNRKEYVTVEVSVAKVESAYSADPAFYVGPGGAGGIDDRYARFAEFLDESVRLGRAVEQPRLEVDGNRIYFGDGRHRWAVLRDRGYATIPVSVRRSEAAKVRELFGA